MPEERLFEVESRLDRAEIADHLERVADALAAGEPITLSAGEETIRLEPPARPTFEISVEREGPADGHGELSVEFEIEWDENEGDERLEIG